jgi:THO complex subunit 3
MERRSNGNIWQALVDGHSDSVDQLCWDPTSTDRLATASADKSVRMWDIRAGSKCTASIPTSGDNINIVWSPDGTTIAVGNRDDVVSFIDARKFKVIKTIKFSFEVNEIEWEPSGKKFYVTTGLGTVEEGAYTGPLFGST